MKGDDGEMDKVSLPKRIKIVKASQQTYWYANTIGIVLSVVGIWRENYLTNHKGKKGLYMVSWEDCQIVEE